MYVDYSDSSILQVQVYTCECTVCMYVCKCGEDIRT